MAADDKRGPLVAGRSVAATSRGATRHDDLDHTALLSGREPAYLAAQRLEFPEWQAQPLAALLQTLEVQWQPARLPLATGDGLEQTVAVLQPAVAAGNAVTGAAIDQRRAHPSAGAASRPRALARVSASSRCHSESATMPAPVRNSTLRSCSVRLRIRIFKSMEPSALRKPMPPV